VAHPGTFWHILAHSWHIRGACVAHSGTFVVHLWHIVAHLLHICGACAAHLGTGRNLAHSWACAFRSWASNPWRALRARKPCMRAAASCTRPGPLRKRDHKLQQGVCGMFWIMQSVLPRQASARPFVRPAAARWPSSAARSACEGLLSRGGRLDSKNRCGPER
jgi:hypothetical protein